MMSKPYRMDVVAGIAAGVLGLVWITAIWATLVFPPPVQIGGGGILSGPQVSIVLHEWGFNQFSKGGPEILEVAGHNITISLRNGGVNLHGFQVVWENNATFRAGLNKTDLLRPGETRQVTIDITQPGSFYYICPVSGHRQKGMIASFVVQAGTVTMVIEALP